MKKILYLSLILSFFILFLSCAGVTHLTADFDQEASHEAFTVTIDWATGQNVHCDFVTLYFTFKDDIVSACRITVTYPDAESAASVVKAWEEYSGIKNVKAKKNIVTYEYIIDTATNMSSPFSGKDSAYVIEEVERFNGVIRGQN